MNLHDLYQSGGVAALRKLADDADSDAQYLYQLATQWRGKRPSPNLARRLIEADDRLTLEELLFPPPR
jgi:hypothetical protein